MWIKVAFSLNCEFVTVIFTIADVTKPHKRGQDVFCSCNHFMLNYLDTSRLASKIRDWLFED